MYTDKWEELENMTGRDGFNDVFAHTRTIFAKERPKKVLQYEFREYVLKNIRPKEFIDDYLEPYTAAYIKLKNCEFSATSHAEEINGLLYWLNRTSKAGLDAVSNQIPCGTSERFGLCPLVYPQAGTAGFVSAGNGAGCQSPCKPV